MTTSEVWNAHIEQCFYSLYRTHRLDNLKPCDANRAMLADYLNEHVLECSQQNLEIAYSALSKQLAREDKPEPVKKPTPPVVETDSAPAITETQRLKGLSKEELKSEVRKLRKYDSEIKVPQVWTSQKIQSLPPSQLLQLLKRFGSKAVNNRLNGRS
jgi:hypothetical protein